MKISRLNGARMINVADSCKATEYQHNDNDLNLAIIEIRGRYPERGCVSNNLCKELVYITEGEINLYVDGVSAELRAGDSIIIDKGKKFYWDGHAKLIIVCTPPWGVDQYSHYSDV